MNIEHDIALAPLTYYKIGGKARYFAQPENKQDLITISEFIQKNKPRVFVLGAGSNVLVSDSGFDGLIIHTAKLNKELKRNGNLVEAGAAVMVIQLLRLCMRDGLRGFERLVGIPGSIGGVIAMNAGTKSGEIKELAQSVEVFNLTNQTTRTVSGNELSFSYRKNHFLSPDDIILSATFAIEATDEPEIVQKNITQLLDARKATQPIDKPSCGSVFKNPNPKEGFFAWKVIEECGLKGQRMGNAQISPMHANFIVNLGGAKASDVQGLIALAKKTALEKFKVTLEEEVQFVS